MRSLAQLAPLHLRLHRLPADLAPRHAARSPLPARAPRSAAAALLQAEGERLHGRDEAQADALPLYRDDAPPPSRQAQTLAFVRCFAAANRGEGEMRVWVDAGGDG
ncbi:hypothetical protein ACFOPN_13735 [Xanthomonas hyacinthi]|uniref:hypothetical protein n=1 Tax=Xanthomonas hyacinthi TaxID=56455 RepID=UPI00062D4536|nr:hypothetical protein [Xanthomonas hyacinthi]KLD74309.1 hypothetical protein Y886_33365 [Xanthomonas hyacinthi DSM 19077]